MMTVFEYWRVAMIALVAVSLMMTSCEDVVEIEVEGSTDGLIIDAWVNNMDTLQSIRVSRAIGYFENTLTPGVTDAQVSLTRADGAVITFQHSADGVYTWAPDTTGVLGQVGDSFSLSVETGGVTYTGQSTINRVPEITALEFEFRDDQLGGDDGLYAEIIARDFPGIGDAYWIKSFRDGVLQNSPQQLNIAYDAGFDSGSGIDGLIFITPIREFPNTSSGGGDTPFVVGEQLRVEIHSISTDAFSFMEIARDQITNGDNGIFALPLANTPTNITASDDSPVLGYFNVAGVSVAVDVASE